MQPKPLIILDRDGVINHDSDEYIKTPEEWLAIPGSLAAISRLNQQQFPVAIATNQSGIARGLFNQESLTKIHQKMLAELQTNGGHIDALVYCPHGPNDDCDCRKPKPGMLKTIAKQLNADLTNAIVIGDSLRDLQAAIAVNAQPILVKTGKGTKTQAELTLNCVTVFDDLAAAVDYLIQNKG